jgi:hypothetical protein
MQQRYQQAQRRGNSIRENVMQSLNDPTLAEMLLDRSRPLPDWMSQNLERCLEEYKKVYLGLYDVKYGLDGSPREWW